jgi:hypothetical protein
MKEERAGRPRLSEAELLQLRRWNTPTIYNGWEQITRGDAGKSAAEILAESDAAAAQFHQNTAARFDRKGQ